MGIRIPEVREAPEEKRKYGRNKKMGIRISEVREAPEG